MLRSLAATAVAGASVFVLGAPALAESDPPTAATIAHNKAVAAAAPFADRQDFDFASRGYMGTLKDPLIRAADGRVVWDLNAFSFAKGDAPATVNPSLWRQAELLAKSGLFKVTDRIYQVRGFDLANITFVQGDTGWIVIDTLTSEETAQAAYDLVSEKLGKRPITAIIITHSHGDHFGGTGGLKPFMTADAPIIAPKGFMEAAVSENVIAGPAMGRRAQYQLGTPLARGPTGTVNSGIGQGLAIGTQSLLPPTREIETTGTELTLDGVHLLFQVTPGTEAPAEMNIAFPDWKVVDMAENANATQHNILTPRGAVVRDAKRWADGLTEAADMFAGYDVMITSHAWPRFGADAVAQFLAKHRDAYAYLHDQTVRMMNQGMTGDEIAAAIKLPPALEQAWYDRPYYGSFSFNSRAVYQYYMGWYDGNPVHLAPLTPQDGGKRYVEALGGAERVRELAKAAFDKGDYAWAAELLNREVFADAGDKAARELLARSYDQLAWQSENALWRNMYLTASQELREGVAKAQGLAGGGMAAALPTADIFSLMATRIDPAKAGDGAVKLAFVFPNRNEQVSVTVENGVLIHREAPPKGPVDATLTVNRGDLLKALVTGEPLAGKIASGEAKISGDPAALAKFVSWLDKPTPGFAIVTP
ncbi:alkyl/aryl-sulfatase [Phenylobacterium sp.]|uniref:alkyl/aryl-sulfatase n=1 Tax=Phenylobacterium sp. TaxID=1871053 RepID=UPI0035AF7F22